MRSMDIPSRSQTADVKLVGDQWTGLDSHRQGEWPSSIPTIITSST